MPSGDSDELSLVEIEGQWCLEADDGEPPLPIPGARAITVEETVAGRLKHVERYGLWIEVSRDVAHSHPELLEWCRRKCNTELPKGGFRFAPRGWETCKAETLSLPFVPELDDPDPVIRELALVERLRRLTERDADYFRRRRDALIRKAADRHSRRKLGVLLGISFGRVQQITSPRSI